MEHKNENRGGVWRNDKKEAGDNKPHFTGKAIVGGVEYRVSCWKADPQSLEENPKRPLLTFQFKSEEEFQQMIQKQGENGLNQAGQVLNQPQQYQQPQQSLEASHMQSPQQQQQYQQQPVHNNAVNFEDDDIPF